MSLRDNLEISYQTIQSLELEHKEYQQEIGKLNERNKDLSDQNSTLMEKQEHFQLEIHVLQCINDETSQELHELGQLHNATQKTAQMASELLKENIDIKQQNDRYKEEIQSMSQKVMSLEKELKHTKNDIQIQQQQHKEVEDKNQILQMQLSQVKMEQKYHDVHRNKSAVTTPIHVNSIVALKHRQSLNATYMNATLDKETGGYSDLYNKTGGYSDLYNKGQQEYIFSPLPGVDETENDNELSLSDSLYSDAETETTKEYETMLETLHSLNTEVQRLHYELKQKDSAIESLNEKNQKLRMSVTPQMENECEYETDTMLDTLDYLNNEVLRLHHELKQKESNDKNKKKMNRKQQKKLKGNGDKMAQWKLQFLFWK
eukprot:25143_1